MSTKIAIRLSGASVLLADTALVAGMMVTLVMGLGPEENLPPTSPEGLARLRELRFHYTLRELLLLLYPVLLLPQGIAPVSPAAAQSASASLASDILGIGLTIGIGVDLFTVGLPSGLGGSLLVGPPELALQLARSADLMVRLAQFVGDNLSGTLAVPFFAVSAYRQGLISRTFAYAGSIATIVVCVGYRSVNLMWPESPWCFVLGLAWYGVIWWDVNIGLTLLRVQTSQIHHLESAQSDLASDKADTDTPPLAAHH